MAGVEKRESFWKRHLVALIVGGFAVLLLVIVAGQLLDEGDVARWLADVPNQWAYLMCLLSLAFTGVLLAVWAIIALTWWVRGDWRTAIAPVLTLAPLTGLWLWVSLQLPLPHKDAPWKALLPGALLVGIGFQVLHEPSLYGGLGATTTVIFFIYLLATLVVTAPILNSSLYEELSRKEGR